jgi:DNA helicase-2/ATP-dependent DNA helicase PcrA
MPVFSRDFNYKETDFVTHPSFSSLFSSMTQEQKQAVMHDRGPALVIAGAGSGKTRVVTMRISYLIQQGLDPSSLLAVTFTNKAAQEMRERIETLVGRQVLVSTFHSLGSKILREFIHHIGYSNDFVIYDADESEKVLKSVLRDLFGTIVEKDVQNFRNSISQIKNGKKCDDVTEKAYEAYQSTLKRSQAVDFDDLIFLPLQLMKEKPEVLLELQARWKYVLVDEYQDANDTQSSLALNLVGKESNIFAVGDPDQSIYSWRGANIQHILKFQEHFPDAQVFRLEQNFRSTNAILLASNAVIEKNQKRLEKRLWSAHGEGPKIGCFVSRTEREEASFLGDSIQELLDSGVGAQKISVLYRTNAQSRSIEDALLERNIAYKIFGGVSFYERREVRDIIAYLRLIIQPYDALSFERAATRPKRGLGAITLQKTIEGVQSRGVSFLDFLRGLPKGEFSEIGLSEKQKKGFASLYDGLKAAQEALSEGQLSQAFLHLIQDTGYITYLESEQETFLERRENINQIVLKAKEWEEEHAEEPIRLFLEEMVLKASSETEDRMGDEKVALMTVHNAKGLEFDAVFVTGMEEDLFPHINSRKDGLEDVEEERRLFYVAMTRARKHLILSCSQVRFLWGGVRKMRPSRFLREVPREYLNPLRGPISLSKNESIHSSHPICLSVGVTVFHPQFGVGRIEAINPSSQGDMLKVFFMKDNACKTLLKDVAPLQLV